MYEPSSIGSSVGVCKPSSVASSICGVAFFACKNSSAEGYPVCTGGHGVGKDAIRCHMVLAQRAVKFQPYSIVGLYREPSLSLTAP